MMKIIRSARPCRFAKQRTDPMIRIVMKNGNKLLLFMFLCLIVSCKHGINDSGNIPMEEFSIRNKSLDSIVRNTLTQLNIDTCQEVVVLDLMWVNNEKVYLLSVQKKSDLMDSYVSWYNRRIVGYTAIGNYLTIILSNVDNHGDFLDIFASDLDLGEKIREFTFMHVPENRYRWITVEGHQLPWQDKAYLYEPTFVVCRPRGGDGYEIIYSNSPFDDAETGTQREYGTCSPNFRAGVPLTKGQK